MSLLRIPVFCAFLIGIVGCTTPPLEKAFEGEFASVENNRLIYEYCLSCHVHRELIPAPHVAEKTDLYKNKKFRETKECRTCHYVEENIFGEFERRTIRPKRGKI